MGALRDQTALNIREWGGRRKQEPVTRLYLSSTYVNLVSVCEASRLAATPPRPSVGSLQRVQGRHKCAPGHRLAMNGCERRYV